MFTFRPHDVVIDPATNTARVIQRTNFIGLLHNYERLYVQEGQVYMGENAPPIPYTDLPGWFWEEWGKLSPDTRRQAGLELPEDKIVKAQSQAADLAAQFDSLPGEIQDQLRALMGGQASTKPKKATKNSAETGETERLPEALRDDSEGPTPEMWACPYCHKEMPRSGKGIHLMWFGRLGRCPDGSSATTQKRRAMKGGVT